ncbi:predicted protein [Nematostella vectensis]|uniref:Bicaudal D-related protein homolog n=1 Tax=Nematostella vectensis TaxID=45351 RepID=A7S4M3_NEMVE|nr:predicted protein [Nematostella vectensis]|eukprot:XP_001633373.1 predicted protein [Nematostella vectensis]
MKTTKNDLYTLAMSEYETDEHDEGIIEEKNAAGMSDFRFNLDDLEEKFLEDEDFARCSEEETNDSDVYAELAQKEKDLLLAAELGKALLEKNEELSQKYEKLQEEFSQRVEQLEQEKHELKLRLERIDGSHELRVQELQADIHALRNELNSVKTASVTDSRSKRLTFVGLTEENQQLHNELAKVKSDQEDLVKELSNLRKQQFSRSISIEDGRLLEIEELREKLSRLEEEKDFLQKMVETLAIAKENLTKEVEGLKESNQLMQKDSADAKSQLNDIEEKLAESRESNLDLLNQLDELKMQVKSDQEDLVKELSNLRKQQFSRSISIEDGRLLEIEELREKLSRLEEEKDFLQKMVETLAIAKENLTKEVEGLKESNQLMQKDSADAKSQLNDIEEKLAESRESNLDLLNQLDELKMQASLDQTSRGSLFSELSDISLSMLDNDVSLCTKLGLSPSGKPVKQESSSHLRPFPSLHGNPRPLATSSSIGVGGLGSNKRQRQSLSLDSEESDREDLDYDDDVEDGPVSKAMSVYEQLEREEIVNAEASLDQTSRGSLFSELSDISLSMLDNDVSLCTKLGLSPSGKPVKQESSSHLRPFPSLHGNPRPLATSSSIGVGGLGSNKRQRQSLSLDSEESDREDLDYDDDVEDGPVSKAMSVYEQLEREEIVNAELRQEIAAVHNELVEFYEGLRGSSETLSSLDTDPVDSRNVRHGCLTSFVGTFKDVITDLLHATQRKNSDYDTDELIEEVNHLKSELYEAHKDNDVLKDDIDDALHRLKLKDTEIARLSAQLRDREQHISRLKEEKSRLLAEKGPDLALDMVYQQALKEKEAALKREYEISQELEKLKRDAGRLDHQLIEAIQQKIELSEQLEEWQYDMAALIDEQVQKQMRTAAKEHEARSKRKPALFSKGWNWTSNSR